MRAAFVDNRNNEMLFDSTADSKLEEAFGEIHSLDGLHNLTLGFGLESVDALFSAGAVAADSVFWSAEEVAQAAEDVAVAAKEAAAAAARAALPPQVAVAAIAIAPVSPPAGKPRPLSPWASLKPAPPPARSPSPPAASSRPPPLQPHPGQRPQPASSAAALPRMPSGSSFHPRGGAAADAQQPPPQRGPLLLFGAPLGDPGLGDGVRAAAAPSRSERSPPPPASVPSQPSAPLSPRPNGTEQRALDAGMRASSPDAGMRPPAAADGPEAGVAAASRTDRTRSGSPSRLLSRMRELSSSPGSGSPRWQASSTIAGLPASAHAATSPRAHSAAASAASAALAAAARATATGTAAGAAAIGALARVRIAPQLPPGGDPSGARQPSRPTSPSSPRSSVRTVAPLSKATPAAELLPVVGHGNASYGTVPASLRPTVDSTVIPLLQQPATPPAADRKVRPMRGNVRERAEDLSAPQQASTFSRDRMRPSQRSLCAPICNMGAAPLWQQSGS